jgi:hypothetical protein
MFAILHALGMHLVDVFKSHARLEALGYWRSILTIIGTNKMARSQGPRNRLRRAKASAVWYEFAVTNEPFWLVVLRVSALTR